jgi:hypothetical protein
LKNDGKYRKYKFEDIINGLGYQRLYHYEFPRYEEAYIKVLSLILRKSKRSGMVTTHWVKLENYGDVNAIRTYEIAISLNNDNEQMNNEQPEKIISDLKKEKCIYYLSICIVIAI